MSILNDVKKVVGIHSGNDAFDADLLMHINTAMFNLMQLGVGPEEGFEVTGQENWEELLGNATDLNAAKSYVFIRVRLLFDRPETSYGIQALERQASEFEWRLEVQTSKEVT